MRRFIIIVEGLPLDEFEEIELPQLPTKGEPIETRYGTCVVTDTEATPEGGQYDGRIVCRIP
jgi:hypothetical protein